MKAGDMSVYKMQQSDGSVKSRPVALLKQVRPFGDWIVCAVSTQLQQEVKGFDLVIADTDRSFGSTGLKSSSLIRLGFINTVCNKDLPGSIGSLAPKVIALLQHRLADYLIK
jgi:mRNA interferase MazF